MTIVPLSTIDGKYLTKGQAHQALTETRFAPSAKSPNHHHRPRSTVAVDPPGMASGPPSPSGKAYSRKSHGPNKAPVSLPSTRTTARSSPPSPSRCPPRPPPTVTSTTTSWPPSASTLSRPLLPPPPSPPLTPPPRSHPHPSTRPIRGEQRTRPCRCEATRAKELWL
jgi:hypothetical protein